MSEFSLTLLGSSAALPSNGRFPTAQVLNANQERLYLIDCGEGTQIRLDDFNIKRSKINQIFISHLHGDHFFGLPGVLVSFALQGRKQTLEIFAPSGLANIIKTLVDYEAPDAPYPILIHEIDPTKHQKIFEDDHLYVYTLPLDHGIPTCGFLFVENTKPRKMIKEKIEKYHIPFDKIAAIKAGADYITPSGEIIENKELTLAPPTPRSYAYCSDTQYNERLVPWIEQVDLLYHESTYLAEDAELAKKYKHSTSIDAAQIARLAKAKRLVLGHYSARYKDSSPFLTEAKKVFPNTELGDDGKIYEI